MKIALFTWEFPPMVVGGLGTFTYELSIGLRRLGHEVTAFTMNDGTLKTREVIEGVEVHRPKLIDFSDTLPEFESEEMRRSGTAAKFFSKVLVYNLLVSTKIANDLIPKEGRSFDLLSVHDWLSAMAGIALKKATGIPMVFHIHSTERGRSLGRGSSIIYDLEKKAANFADRIVTVSNAMREELITCGFPSGKIDVVWNGVDTSKYSPERVKMEERQAIRSRYGVSDGERMLLFLGRLTAVKGVDRLVMAMPHILQRFPNTRLVVVGKGDLEEELLRLSENLGIKDRVAFDFRMLPEDERVCVYAASDIAVFPSIYEPFGIVALEAMAMEKPVVVGARGVSGMREIVVNYGDRQCGYHINPYDPMDIAWGVNNLLGDPDKIGRYGKNARARVLESFTMEMASRKISDIYASVAGKASAANR
uniref:Glycosyltransferase family 1 protein n=1 Tax=Candidatus Methanosuratincola petrocarbonis (ex Vanwonterghem et al. 2016) TaxID=1867261 RepID=A0A7J3UXS8_9CREN